MTCDNTRSCYKWENNNSGSKTRIQSDKVTVEKAINPAKLKNIIIIGTNTEEPLEGVDFD